MPSSKRHENETNPPIFKLSSEVLTYLYERLHRPADLVKFALSCKQFTSIAKNAKLKQTIIISPTKIPRVRWYSSKDLLQDLKGWAPRKHCRTCQKGLPRQRIWRMKDGTEITKLKRVDWLWAVKDWLGEGRMCPPCRISEHYEGLGGWLQSRAEGFALTTMFHNVYHVKS